MTIFCVTADLAIRVGPQGIWIWAPSVSPQPIHLDRRRLEEMGLFLVGDASAVLPASLHAAAAYNTPILPPASQGSDLTPGRPRL